MSKFANKVVDQAISWLGCKESDGSHKKIIDIYNAHNPLARGYKVKYTDAWCATFVSAVAIACGYTDIIPTECGCGEMVKLFQKIGSWVESDYRKPSPGDVIFYDWQDTGKDDNQGWPDHVGIVEKVSAGTITVIEGNYSNSVKRRYIAINGKNIRGYGVPKYEEGPIDEKGPLVSVMLPQLYKGCEGNSVKSLQQLLIAKGYSCGNAGDDGIFGSDTDAAVLAFKKAHGLTVGSIVGKDTWTALITE